MASHRSGVVRPHIYRAWTILAAQLVGHVLPQEAQVGASGELQLALFALGIGTGPLEVGRFLEGFCNLPWGTHASTVLAADERAVAFVALVRHLSFAAVTRTQRMRLAHQRCPCFVSYARVDEAVARQIVEYLEGEGS